VRILCVSFLIFIVHLFPTYLSITLSLSSRYVGQEPTLFSGSISENIARGRAEVDVPLLSLQEVMVLEKAGGCLSVLPMRTASKENKKMDNDIEQGHSKDGTPEDVLVASKLSYSHEFITSFTEGYNTDVGESAVMVSGGQKQVIRNKIKQSIRRLAESLKIFESNMILTPISTLFYSPLPVFSQHYSVEDSHRESPHQTALYTPAG
jgi:hypothetical protein